jgi:hypothetical protein
MQMLQRTIWLPKQVLNQEFKQEIKKAVVNQRLINCTGGLEDTRSQTA